MTALLQELIELFLDRVPDQLDRVRDATRSGRCPATRSGRRTP